MDRDMINRRKLFSGLAACSGVTLMKPAIARSATFAARAQLDGNLDLYVALNGNDDSDGLSPSTPLRHLQTAFDLTARLFDTCGFDVILNVADGDWQETLNAHQPLLGRGAFHLVGSAQSAIENFRCSITNAGESIISTWQSKLFVKGIRVVNTLSGSSQCLRATRGGYLGYYYCQLVSSGFCGYVDQQGALLEQVGDVGIDHPAPLAYTCSGHFGEARMSKGVCVALCDIAMQEATLVAIANGAQTVTGTASFDSHGHAVSGYRTLIRSNQGAGLQSSIAIDSILGSLDRSPDMG
jgi:hypothetical protein